MFISSIIASHVPVSRKKALMHEESRALTTSRNMEQDGVIEGGEVRTKKKSMRKNDGFR